MTLKLYTSTMSKFGY